VGRLAAGAGCCRGLGDDGIRHGGLFLLRKPGAGQRGQRRLALHLFGVAEAQGMARHAGRAQ
jgi:hypothetical protein